MQKNSYFYLSLLILIVTGFIYGIYQLFIYRFQKGDIFQEYSTLRSDEQGSKAYLETLRLFDDIEIEQNLLPLNQLKEKANTTFIFIGLTNNQIRNNYFFNEQTVQRILRNNNRLVLLLNPEIYTTFLDSLIIQNDSIKIKNKEKYNFANYLGFAIKFFSKDSLSSFKENDIKKNIGQDTLSEKISSIYEIDTREISKMAYTDIYNSEILNLPLRIKWDTKLYLEVQEDWLNIYNNADKPVICELIKKDFSVILATDSYFFKNKNFRDERETEFILWLTGNNRKIIIDESHFGIAKQNGISYLIKKYRLFYAVLILLFLGILFIWKSMDSFLPKTLKISDKRDENTLIVENGIVGLLKQNLSTKELIKICYEERKKSLKISKKAEMDNMSEIENIVSGKTVNKNQVVDSYNKIYKILNRRKNG